MLLTHPAFDGVNTHLEKLAAEYNIKIIWCPKYHCELNPIEGVWCDLKNFVRRNNDQDFNKFFRLICSSLDQYENKKLGIKLWGRFWKALEIYENNSSYQDVLQTLFGARSSATVKNHKNNKSFNTNIK